MEILAHRGWWMALSEKNTIHALRRALEAGYGIETDLRDCLGTLIISHDIPTREHEPYLTLDHLLDVYLKCRFRPTLALNIKADGLVDRLMGSLGSRGIDSYFAFDMSIPETVQYLRKGLAIYTRRSEFEAGSSLDKQSPGRWLDAFEMPYVPVSEISAALAGGTCVAIVSPELHNKPHGQAWTSWRELFASLTDEERARLKLCTDFPDKAERFFSGSGDL